MLRADDLQDHEIDDPAAAIIDEIGDELIDLVDVHGRAGELALIYGGPAAMRLVLQKNSELNGLMNGYARFCWGKDR
jgi:hypothetical protein